MSAPAQNSNHMLGSNSITVTLDRPRVLVIDAAGIQRFKKASGVDLTRGEVFSGHQQTVQFIWALAVSADPSVKADDLAPFVTAETWTDIALKLDNLNRRLAHIRPGRN